MSFLTLKQLPTRSLCTALFFSFIFVYSGAVGQNTGQNNKKQGKAQTDTLFNMTLSEGFRPTIELNPTKTKDKTEKQKKRNKKRKKKVFYGMKTKRRYMQTKNGGNQTIEVFHVLKQYKSPNKYVYKKYYYNHKERAISAVKQVSPDFGNPLHGTYLRITNGDTIVRGIYYVGVKHGRWEQYYPGQQRILRDKKYYYQGFPKEGEVTYWDVAETQPKEIVPIQLGVKNGIYIAYYKSGRIKEVGEYDDDHKVKLWQEFYDQDKNNKKRQTKHPDRPWSEKESMVLREWDEEGHLIKSLKRR